MKPRRDITLGEMQDECAFRGGDCTTQGGGTCSYFDVCGTMGKFSPLNWEIADPPRFNEAQMALLKALHGTRVTKIMHIGKSSFQAIREEDAGDKFLGVIEMGENETLDLAELLGKDGAE